MHDCRCVSDIDAAFYDHGQKAPLPPLANRVVMDSGGGTKDVGTFGDQRIEVPPGPVAGEFDGHPACALDENVRRRASGGDFWGV